MKIHIYKTVHVVHVHYLNVIESCYQFFLYLWAVDSISSDVK